MHEGGHEELEHIGELRLRLRAPTREALFAEAARALAGVMADAGGLEPGTAEEHTVELSGRDLDALLVDWLNELVFLAETRGVVVTSCAIALSGDGAVTSEGVTLQARVHGARPRAWKTAVKAATYSDLAVRRADDGVYEASVVLDV